MLQFQIVMLYKYFMMLEIIWYGTVSGRQE